MATVFGLLGGLALFIFGMNMMSESLQKVAGDKMKKVLGVLTRNAVCGMLAGALVTAVLQSSSATTVLVIGFVSAGLMSLKQGISVIFGANIGTTMTAQLMAFKISDYIMPIVFIGFLIAFIAKKEKIKFVGQTIFAFGLLFVGIEMMGDVMKPLATSPVFINMMEKVSNIPVLGVGVGMLMTLVVQSSSATIAVLQSFASQAGPDGASVIGLVGAIPILLGDNIGTTITAILASIGQSKDAKRCAIAHSVFNITGSFIFIWIIKPFAKFVEMISPKGNELDVISRQIANAHMSFNIINTLIWLPLLPVMVKIVMFIVRDDKEVSIEDYKEKSFLDKNVISQPIAAMYLVSQEIRRAGRLVSEMIGNMKATVMNNDSKALAELEKNDLCRSGGVPVFWRRLRRRYVLLAGAVLTLVLMFGGNLVIWDFQVSGNDTVPTETILRALEDYGITVGSPGLHIDQETMRNHVLLALPEVSWLAVNVRGCVAHVQVVERHRPPEAADRSAVTNIVARRSGLITKVEALDILNMIA